MGERKDERESSFKREVKEERDIIYADVGNDEDGFEGAEIVKRRQTA